MLLSPKCADEVTGANNHRRRSEALSAERIRKQKVRQTIPMSNKIGFFLLPGKYVETRTEEQ